MSQTAPPSGRHLPEQEEQRQAARQHVGAALHRWRNDTGPHPLERGPRHDAVLHGEQAEQSQVDEQRPPERSDRRPVEGLRHYQVTDEACGVEERSEEDGVRDDAVSERDDPSHDLSPRQVVIQPRASATDDGSCAAVAVLVPPTYQGNPARGALLFV
jgi:hypothetical protein